MKGGNGGRSLLVEQNVTNFVRERDVTLAGLRMQIVLSPGA